MALTTGRTWEQYLADNGLVDSLTEKDYLVLLRLLGDTANPNTGSNIVIPAKFAELFQEVTLTSTNFKGIGSSPFTLVSAPSDILNFLAPTKVIFKKNAGSIAPDFSEDLIIKAGGDVLYFISKDEINIPGAIMLDLVKQGQRIVIHSPLTITTVDGSNATVGDSSVKIKTYYKVETSYL